jgi:tRNA modification GTPase
MDAKHNSASTIAAIATPPGVGGLAVVRCSGPESTRIADACFRSSNTASETPTHTIRYGWWYSGDTIVDSVTISVFRSPQSYTGEDVVEIGCHGGPFVARQILDDCLASGAILAGPGEFTQRAFVNGRMDMTQVEAVSDLINAQSRLGARAAARQLHGAFKRTLMGIRTDLLHVAALLELELDFSEEDVEFVDRSRLAEQLGSVISVCNELASSALGSEILRSGFHVTIVGHANAGKSTLFNNLLGRERAIVSEIEGTTRDYIVEHVIIDGTTVHLADTAGIRSTHDSIELRGIHLTHQLIQQSNAVILVNDVTRGTDNSSALLSDIQTAFDSASILLVNNKSDQRPINCETVPDGMLPTIFASSSDGSGVELIRKWISERIASETAIVGDVLVNQRHAILLKTIANQCEDAIRALHAGESPDLAATDIRLAIQSIGQLTGETWNPDILNHVFSSFCIGK